MSKRRSIAEWHALIYQTVSEKPGYGAEAIAKHAGIGVASFRKHAEDMVRDGILRRKVYDSDWSNGSYRYFTVDDAERVLREPLELVSTRLKTLQEEYLQVHRNTQDEMSSRLAFERYRAMDEALSVVSDILSLITSTVEGMNYQARKKATVNALKQSMESSSEIHHHHS
jgi:predicted DNA-binding transcriptional regulator